MERDLLRGNLFENLVIAEVIKEAHHQSQLPQVAFFRDKQGNEIDLIVEHREGLVAIEVKSAETISSSFFKELNYFEKLSGEDLFRKCLIYGGQTDMRRSETEIMSGAADSVGSHPLIEHRTASSLSVFFHGSKTASP